jgi:uncharacterized protein YcaQ
MERLTADEVRLAALWAQGFIDPIGGATPATVGRLGQGRRQDLIHVMLRHLGAVQLDTISVLARSHELIPYARFGAIGRANVEDSYWESGLSFEYWSHAACILPMESWPLFEFRRRFYRDRGIRWHEVPESAVRDVTARLRGEGPLTTAHIGGAKRGGEWWDWSESKVAIEWLLDIGEVVVSRRIGWRREYDLAERVVPVELMSAEPDDAACVVALVADSARTLGVGTAADVADVHRLKTADVRRHAIDAGLTPVEVEGWGEAAWADPGALAWLGSRSRARHRTTLLSPFDSLVWHRPRTERIFGLEHRLEAYTPAHKRVHGYFAMPVLHQGRLVARVDPKREKDGLHARRVTFESTSQESVRGTARAIREAASWVGADRVVVGEVVPASAGAALRRAVAAAG